MRKPLLAFSLFFFIFLFLFLFFIVGTWRDLVRIPGSDAVRLRDSGWKFICGVFTTVVTPGCWWVPGFLVFFVWSCEWVGILGFEEEEGGDEQGAAPGTFGFLYLDCGGMNFDCFCYLIWCFLADFGVFLVKDLIFRAF